MRRTSPACSCSSASSPPRARAQSSPAARPASGRNSVAALIRRGWTLTDPDGQARHPAPSATRFSRPDFVGLRSTRGARVPAAARRRGARRARTVASLRHEGLRRARVRRLPAVVAVTKLFWDARPRQAGFVAEPPPGRPSTTAAARWTMSLFDLATGREARCRAPTTRCRRAPTPPTPAAPPRRGRATPSRGATSCARGVADGARRGVHRSCSMGDFGHKATGAQYPILDVPFRGSHGAYVAIRSSTNARRNGMARVSDAWLVVVVIAIIAVMAMGGTLQPPGRALAGRGRAVGAGGERLPAPRRPHPQPGGHRAGRGQLREVDAGGGDAGAGQRGPGRAAERGSSPTTPPPSPGSRPRRTSSPAPSRGCWWWRRPIRT